MRFFNIVWGIGLILIVSCINQPDEKDEDNSIEYNVKILVEYHTEISGSSDLIRIIRKKLNQYVKGKFEINKLPHGKLEILIEDENFTSSKIDKVFHQGGKLEFWECYSLEEVYDTLLRINDLYIKYKGISAYPLYEKLFLNTNPEGKPIDSPVIGYVRPNDIDTINNYFEKASDKGIISNRVKHMWSVKPVTKTYHLDTDKEIYELYMVKADIPDEIYISGKDVNKARESMNEYSGSFNVNIEFNDKGAQKFALLTRNNVNRAIAISVNGKVYTAPKVMEEITGGMCQISGDFSHEEAKELAEFINSGLISYNIQILSVEYINNKPK